MTARPWSWSQVVTTGDPDDDPYLALNEPTRLTMSLIQTAQDGFLVAQDDVPLMLREGVVAIGNFDGVHRGHQAVLRAAIDRGRIVGGPVVALTFEPHPRQFFRPETPLFRLTPPHAKAELFEALGLNGVVILSFNADLSGLDAKSFSETWLTGKFAAQDVVVGHDFHFGKGREGSAVRLSELGLHGGYQVTIVGAQQSAAGDLLASTAIRAALSEGDVETARGQLGYRWFFEAEVVHGQKRGRDLGYPTANMRLDPAATLKHGVYAVRGRIGDRIVGGVASFGRRPQFDNGAPLFETFFFDLDRDLYGQMLEVELVRFLRPEAAFDSVDALVAQMHDDAAAARDIIAALGDEPFGPEALSASVQ